MSGAEGPVSNVIPVVLFAYGRPVHLARTLASLCENKVPLIEAFADGAKCSEDAAAVAETRRLLRAIDWCPVRLTERADNLGLGRNVLAGVTEIAARYESFIVWEDDLVSVPGTYAWLCAALRHYASDERAMSVTAWTHPRIKPSAVIDEPYFDGRAECWVWGCWARSWRGMNAETAFEKMAAMQRRGISPDKYGADLPPMARAEKRTNVWAVRWLYHHLLHGGLCLRPPRSMVEHIGFDGEATNAAAAGQWANPPLQSPASLPTCWPDAIEHPDCQALWTKANPPSSIITRGVGRLRRIVQRMWQ